MIIRYTVCILKAGSHLFLNAAQMGGGITSVTKCPNIFLVSFPNLDSSDQRCSDGMFLGDDNTAVDIGPADTQC